jgi:hypothetical protein
MSILNFQIKCEIGFYFSIYISNKFVKNIHKHNINLVLQQDIYAEHHVPLAKIYVEHHVY